MKSNWTWDEINTDWLAGNLLALSPEEIVAAFNRVEHMLGRDWIESSRLYSGSPVRGTSPTLHVVTVGQMLASLDGVRGAEDLLERLRSGDESAFAELTAVHLVRLAAPISTVELGPVAKVGSHRRKPDFRVRGEDQPWTYVEVAQPNKSHAQKDAEEIMERLSAPLHGIQNSFGLELFLRRRPTPEELVSLETRVPRFCSLQGYHSEDLPGLGKLILNQHQPGQVVLDDHGEEYVPRLGRVQVIGGSDEPHRHIVVRMPFADERAVDFLESEAKQLPNDSPGLIMIQVSRAPGALKVWEPLLRRRFQPTLHTRVGAVCLFRSGHELTPSGEAWVPETKLLLNQYARLPLPAWITASLSKFESKS